jgi:hypothetical protein
MYDTIDQIYLTYVCMYVCIIVNAAGLRKGSQVDTKAVDGVHLVVKDHGPGMETKAVQGE